MENKVLKYVATIIIIISALCCTGCTSLASLTEDNTPVQLRESLNQMRQERSEAMRKFNDLEFSLSADRESHLVSSTVIKRRPFNVTLICSTPEGIVGAKVTENGHLDYINDCWRELVAETIMARATEDKQLLKARDKGEIKVIGAIVTWRNGTNYYSLCNYNNDGIWDVVSTGTIELYKEKSSLDKIAPYVDDYGNEVYIYGPSEITELAEDITTFKEVEKLLS